MARADKIYIVFDSEEADPEDSFRAAFTVKHEMITWCQKQHHKPGGKHHGWQLCVFRDGTNKHDLLPLPDEAWEKWVPPNQRRDR